MLTICCGNVLPLALLDLSCASFLFGSGAPWQDPWGRDGPRPRNHLRLEMPHPLVVRRAFQGVRNLTVSYTFEHCGLFPRWKQTRDRTGTRSPREAPVPGPAHRRGRRSGRQEPRRRRGLPPRARELREGARGSPPSVLLSPPCATPGNTGRTQTEGHRKPRPIVSARAGRPETAARGAAPARGAWWLSMVAEPGGRAWWPSAGPCRGSWRRPDAPLAAASAASRSQGHVLAHGADTGACCSRQQRGLSNPGPTWLLLRLQLFCESEMIFQKEV